MFLCVLDNLARLHFLLLSFFFNVFFVSVWWVLMDISNMEEDQVVYNATQVLENSGASSIMMGLYDILRNIEQMLVPFMHYIEASEDGMAQAPPMAQVSPMTQGLPVVQTTHANVSVGNAKEPKFIMPKKFEGTRSKFHGFVQHVNLFLRLHPSCYPDDSTQVAFIGSLLSGNALS
jgi:hypothetical protein